LYWEQTFFVLFIQNEANLSGFNSQVRQMNDTNFSTDFIISTPPGFNSKFF